MQQHIEQLEQVLASVQQQLAALKAANAASAPAVAPTVASAKPVVVAPVKPVQPAAVQQASAPVLQAPEMNPGSTTPSAAGTDPAAVANQTVGTRQPTHAEEMTHRFFERKPGRDLTFYTHGGELTVYGNLDVAFDASTKGISNLTGPDGNPPGGNMGWLPDLSTNLSYVGIRGVQSTNFKNLNFIYQLETQLDISATSGVSETNSMQSNQVKGGLTSRNSYIGVGNRHWGALLFGKTDAPYKQSTARLNPFVAMIGDYAVIMGNTGGDNRVEFGGRLDHSLWLASSNLRGFEVNVLYSPGQNRSGISDNIAAGESDCTGGDIPGSGGSLPYACNDGSFSDAVSADVSYTKGPLYAVMAYERHQKVNRQSDLTGVYANVPTDYFNADVADEDAGKVGLQYTFAKKTTVSAI